MDLEKTVKLEHHLYARLAKDIQELLQASKQASTTAYAPYSSFFVGCSAKLEDSSIISGSNQENSSFPSGLCAERTVLFQCGAALAEKPIIHLAVFASSSQYKVPTPLVPCAGCLQVIIDFEKRQNKKIHIWMWDGGKQVYLSSGADQFLPFHFSLEK